MLAKQFSKFFSTTKPHVWVNKHTKVICQGITGKEVRYNNKREHFKLSKLWLMEPRW